MLRRMILVLTLALLFGTGQQGALMHAVTHLADAQEQQQQDKKHSTSACEQCVAYAKLAGAVPSTAFAIPAAPATYIAASQPLLNAQSIAYRAYSARAPPFLA